MTAQTLPGRVTDLESDVLQHRHRLDRLDAIGEVHSAEHQTIGTKLDDLSADVRALGNEFRADVLPRLDRLESDVAQLKRGMSALLDHFEISWPAPPAAGSGSVAG